jgi:hypothetical protein
MNGQQNNAIGVRYDRHAQQDVPAVTGDGMPRPFLVLVTKDGGVAGGGASNPVDCTYTYTVKSYPGAVTLKKNNAGDNATGMTPWRPRFKKMEYWYAGQDRGSPYGTTPTIGYALRQADGQLVLIECLGEIPKDDPCVTA